MSRKEFEHIQSSFLSQKREPYSHEYFTSGVSPFTRGIYATMYAKHHLEIISEENKSLHLITPISSTDVEELLSDTVQQIRQYIEQGMQKQKDIKELFSILVVELPLLEQPFDMIAFAKVIRTIGSKIGMDFSKSQPLALQTALKMPNDDIIKAMAAIFCGVQYLFIPKNSLYSKEEWNYFIKEELQLMTTIDAWGGNSYIEKKVDYLLKKY